MADMSVSILSKRGNEVSFVLSVEEGSLSTYSYDAEAAASLATPVLPHT